MHLITIKIIKNKIQQHLGNYKPFTLNIYWTPIVLAWF